MRTVAKFTALTLLVGLGIYGTVTVPVRPGDSGDPESPVGSGPHGEAPPARPSASGFRHGVGRTFLLRLPPRRRRRMCP